MQEVNEKTAKGTTPKICKRLPAGAPMAELLLAHKRKMDAKTLRRERDWLAGNNRERVKSGLARSTSIAQANRHTGKPHEHKAEIARRAR